jgi:hypothetical protein
MIRKSAFVLLFLCAMPLLAQDTHSQFLVMTRLDYLSQPSLYGVGRVVRSEPVLFGSLFLIDWDVTLAMEYPEALPETDETMMLRAYVFRGRIYIYAGEFTIAIQAFGDDTRKWLADHEGRNLIVASKYHVSIKRGADGLARIGIHKVP